MGDDSGADDLNAIKKFKEDFSAFRAKMNQELLEFMKKRGKTFTKTVRIDQPINEETFTIYAYPLESVSASR